MKDYIEAQVKRTQTAEEGFCREAAEKARALNISKVEPTSGAEHLFSTLERILDISYSIMNRETKIADAFLGGSELAEEKEGQAPDPQGVLPSIQAKLVVIQATLQRIRAEQSRYEEFLG